MRLKRWESPRREGRNHKGKGGSARQRQLKKQTQILRQRLKGEQGKKEKSFFSLFFGVEYKHPSSFNPVVARFLPCHPESH